MNLITTENRAEFRECLVKWLQLLEKTALFLALTGVAFWLSDFPKATIWVTIGLLSLAFAYFLKAVVFRDSNKAVSVTYRFGYMGCAFTLVVVFTRFMFWDNYQVYALGASLFFSISLLLQLFKLEQGAIRAKRNLKFAFFLILIIISQAVSPLQLFAFKYSEDAEMVRLYKQATENPENSQFQQELEKYRENKRQGKRFLPE